MSSLKDDLIQLILKEDIEGFNALKEKNNISSFDLSEVDFNGLTLNNINLNGVDLNGANFGESSLEGADLTDANLTSANFSGANLQYCNFNNSNLSGVHFCRATIIEADFSEANLNGSDLREADLTGSDLSTSVNLPQTKFDKFTVWPDNQHLPDDFDTNYNASYGYEDNYEEKMFDGELEDN